MGITFYEGKGFRTFKDPKPSCESKIAELVQNYPIKSRAVVSHIRQANRGGVNLENTHPFTRELWGRYWTLRITVSSLAIKTCIQVDIDLSVKQIVNWHFAGY